MDINPGEYAQNYATDSEETFLFNFC